MELRFHYGQTADHHCYEDKQLETIDAMLDDTQIRQRFAPTYKSCQTGMGRIPLDPAIAYRSHVLYFLKRDIISFNELPSQVHKDADYAAFCRCEGVSFTPGYLSQFRKHHLDSEMAQQLHQDILAGVASELASSTEPLRIGLWDSVPMPSYSSPYKDTKHCDCQDACDCPKHFSDADATLGWQRPTPTRKDKFLGYRKHTILLYDEDKDLRLPLVTALQPAHKADIQLIEEMLPQVAGKLDMLLVDQAIYDFALIVSWYEKYGVWVLVKPKSNAVLKDYPVSDTATPCCPQMDQPLEWSYFDAEDKVQVYRCGKPGCFYEFGCPRQFELPLEAHPALLGVFPPHTRCGRLLLALRGLIETEFGVQTLWARLKRLPFRGIKPFRLLAQLADTVRLLQKLALTYSS